VSSTETIEVVSASPREAHWLGIPNRRPLLAITRITRDGADRPFEYAYDLFRADRVRLTATTSSVAARERPGADGRVERSVSSG
jgi:GntR family transcriptional regulator